MNDLLSRVTRLLLFSLFGTFFFGHQHRQLVNLSMTDGTDGAESRSIPLVVDTSVQSCFPLYSIKVYFSHFILAAEKFYLQENVAKI